MHTDEYEISLSRELDVCKKTIRKLQKSLHVMEKKYNTTTDKFVEEYPGNRFPSGNKDFIGWISNYEALRKWEERKREFEEIFHRMKI
jgi:hypothetical protein